MHIKNLREEIMKKLWMLLPILLLLTSLSACQVTYVKVQGSSDDMKCGQPVTVNALDLSGADKDVLKEFTETAKAISNIKTSLPSTEGQL